MARSRSPGLLKSHELPSGPGRMSKATAGKTPNLGSRAAAAVARGRENASAAVARASPGVAPAAKSDLARSTASSR
eukprot:15446647-Alexandrium_andersonii.AAC.1